MSAVPDGGATSAGPWWSDGRFGDGAPGLLSPHDRGLTAGLGVFETIGAVAGALPLWPHHMQRLRHGAGVTAEGDAAP